MREIKFRVWEPRHEIMLYTQVVQFANGQIDRAYGEGWKFSDDSEPNMIPMQYTGLKDKNGKEIYEGDILKWVDWDWTMVVKWDNMVNDDGCSVGFNFGMGDQIVIGNIYENPELIKNL